MLRKIIDKIKGRSKNYSVPPKGYTREQLANAYRLGYNDGRRDGLSVAREQATKSLKEILWQQNQKKQ